ncbi:MAG TPA: hypothetical protein VJP41_12170 [Gaiellaceae bacterium]|nr:hypothetical protein [Gaiellaceae bacterium]
MDDRLSIMKTVAVTVAVALVAAAATASLVAATRSSPPPVAFRELAKVPAVDIPTGFAAAGGLVWVTVRGDRQDRAGTAFGFDRSGTLRQKLAVGSVPVAVAASSGGLWVGNGTVPGYRRTLGNGTVEEFTGLRTGPVGKRSFPLAGPEALAVSAPGAVVLTSAEKTGFPVSLRRLPRLGQPLTLRMSVADETTGVGPVIVACVGNLYAVGTTAAGTVEVATMTQSVQLRSLSSAHTTGVASLACARTKQGRAVPLLVISGRHGGIRCLLVSDGCAAGVHGDPNVDAAVGAGNGVLLAVDPAAFGPSAGIERIDLTSGKLLTVTKAPSPGPVRLAASSTNVFLFDSGAVYAVTAR